MLVESFACYDHQPRFCAAAPSLSKWVHSARTCLKISLKSMAISIDVVVRTQADAARSRLLFRALDSIQNQQRVLARPVVVVNGSKVDPAVWGMLQQRKGILLHRVPEGSAGIAMAAGRQLVTAPYFAYLDDDDEFIANALAKPASWLDSHPECDVLITNGYFVAKDGSESELTDISAILRTCNPSLSLIEHGWLLQGAFICRAATVPAKMFEAQWSNMEWTRLAFEICGQMKRVNFMNEPTMRYYDTPGSLSKQARHHEAELRLMGEVKSDARFDSETQRAAGHKYLRILHNLSATYLRQGQWRHAWSCHLKSLRWPYIFRYLAFSRKLLWPVAFIGSQAP